jgi:hypothetical protein
VNCLSFSYRQSNLVELLSALDFDVRVGVSTGIPLTPSSLKRVVAHEMASFSEAKAHLRSSSMTRLPASHSYTLVLQQDAPTSAPAVGSSSAATAAATDAVYRKVSTRLLPLFMAMLVLNWLDRSCLAFASIQMTQELHFTPEVCTANV